MTHDAWNAGTIAAICSALAALMAAISSFLIMRIQRRSLLESVRPELVLTGWTRSQRANDDHSEVLAYETIRNIGRGAALHVHINAGHIIDNRPAAFSTTKRLAILGPSDSFDIRGEIGLWWKNVPQRDGGKYLPINIRIFAWDSSGRRHETTYSLFAVDLGTNGMPPPNVGLMDEIASGVMLSFRKTVARPVWWLKMRGRLARLPGVGKFLTEGS